MKLREIGIAVCVGLLWAVASVAQDAKPMDKQPSERMMSAEEKAMMETWAKFAMPSEGHQKLAGMVGTWDTEVTSWMTPGQPPTKSKGTSENRMVLGGRYVEQKFRGDMMGQPFEGLGYTGYDNYKKKYVGTWADNMSTAVMVSEGTFDAAGKVMTSMSMMDDPMTNKPSKVKMVTTVMDPDHHVFEMWGPGPDGKDHKNMEIHYRRRK